MESVLRRVVSKKEMENAGTSRSRRVMGLNWMAMSRNNVLWAVNNGEANGGTPSASATSDGSGAEAAPGVELGEREVAEQLLAVKMKGKSKNDFKVGSGEA